MVLRARRMGEKSGRRMAYFKFRFMDPNNQETSELYGRLAGSSYFHVAPKAQMRSHHEVDCFLPIIRWRPFPGYCLRL